MLHVVTRFGISVGDDSLMKRGQPWRIVAEAGQQNHPNLFCQKKGPGLGDMFVFVGRKILPQIL